MSKVIAKESRSFKQEAPGYMQQQVPLSFLKAGETARVSRIRGGNELHRHLETLGFVEGSEVKVVCENRGNLIVEVKGAQVGLNRQTAAKIITK